jgi:hypothetical protein
MSESIEEENVVVLFRTFDELASDEAKIIAEYHQEWEQAYKAYDAAQSAVAASLAKVIPYDPHISKMFGALKKLAQEMPERRSEIETMSADLTELAAGSATLKRRLAEQQALTSLSRSLATAVTKRDERLYGFGALARRSQRFANAQARKSYGPAATSLPPAS